jgi:Mrp family chromosome partitioning ATPase
MIEIEQYAKLFRENAERNDSSILIDSDGILVSKVDPERVRLKVERLQELHDEAQAKTLTLGRKNLEIANYQAEMTRTQKRLDATNTRVEQLNIESFLSGRISVLSEAETPILPSNAKRRVQITILGGLIGSALGVGFVVLLGYFNPRIRDMADAKDGRPKLLGALPELSAHGSDPADAMIAAQCIHQVRTMLQARMRPREALALTVTGATSGTGKTSLVLSLGLSFASAGTRTLLIDGDPVGRGLTRSTRAVGHRKLGRVFRGYDIISDDESKQALELAQRTGSPVGQTLLQLGYINETDLKEGLAIQEEFGLGLHDALAGERIEDCTTDIGIPNLTILPTCQSASAAMGSLSQALVSDLIENLRDSYEVILIDTGPVPGPTNASVLSACADGVVMVVSRGDQNGDVQQALEHLQLINAPVMGLVFNRAGNKDLARSGYSSSRSSTRDQYSEAERTVVEEQGLVPCPEKYARFGPLPQAVLSTSIVPITFADSSTS